MTLERASELVRKLLLTDSNAAIDLFCYFVETLDIINSESFAALCGVWRFRVYAIRNIKPKKA